MKDILCTYYTRSGLTKAVMEKIAAKLDAELIEYTDGKDRSGFSGYLGACFAALSRKYPEVHDIHPERPLSEYSHVIVGMPVWAESPCPVGKGFLKKYGSDFPDNVSIVLTHMAKADYSKALGKLNALLKKPFVYSLSVSTKNNDPTHETEKFADLIK